MVGTSPANATTGIPLNAVIVLQFSKPLNGISVSNGLQVQTGGQSVSGATALSNSNEQVTFTPLRRIGGQYDVHRLSKWADHRCRGTRIIESRQRFIYDGDRKRHNDTVGRGRESDELNDWSADKWSGAAAV